MKMKNITVLGALALTIIGIPTVFTLNHAANADSASNYPFNEQGQTYGPVPHSSKSTHLPDLISATGENGVVGYVKATDLDPKVSSPEEAIAYQKSIEAIGYKSVPLYKSDGKTVIGEFRLYSSNGD
ncbi:hypothetical protein [Brevibacillus sp. NRS-1366]|uniref:hypothetical protein n=1 Tax=Brevibacillus sp. NRS-1366 TaxID=3233899 RepID=UPI003D1C8944